MQAGFLNAMILGLLLVLTVLILLFKDVIQPSPSCSPCRLPSAVWRWA